MPRTPEQVLREIVANQTFAIAQMTAENENLKEETQKLAAQVKELNETVQKLILNLNNDKSAKELKACDKMEGIQ